MDGSESMKNITKIIISTFLVILLANGALGFTGMGGNASNMTYPAGYWDDPANRLKQYNRIQTRISLWSSI